MGVYINMEMPKSCTVCPFENFGDCYGGKVKAIMDIDDYVSAGKRHPRCPLVPVPPHGRTICADALMREMHNVILEDGEDRRTFYSVIERQPTIIPADPEEEEMK